jgi:hypothetical protein
MAIRTESIRLALPESQVEAGDSLAALPVGVIVAVFDSRTEAVGAAVQLAVDDPDGSVWIASGAEAGMRIRVARAARSFLHRLVSGISDDDALVQRVIAEAERDKTVLVVQPDGAKASLARLAGAHHVIEFGRWTTRPLR